jgi:hypothetical protein
MLLFSGNFCCEFKVPKWATLFLNIDIQPTLSYSAVEETFKFSTVQSIIWRVSSSGIWRRVVRRVVPDVCLLAGLLNYSSTLKMEAIRFSKHRVQLYGLHGVISQKMILLILCYFWTRNNSTGEINIYIVSYQQLRISTNKINNHNNNNNKNLNDNHTYKEKKQVCLNTMMLSIKLNVMDEPDGLNKGAWYQEEYLAPECRSAFRGLCIRFVFVETWPLIYWKQGSYSAQNKSFKYRYYILSWSCWELINLI